MSAPWREGYRNFIGDGLEDRDRAGLEKISEVHVHIHESRPDLQTSNAMNDVASLEREVG